MDILKVISLLLWLLGTVLIAPTALRYFDMDAKTLIRKVLVLDEKPAEAAAQSLSAREIEPEIFDELFEETPPLTPQQRRETEEEFEQLIAGLERVSSVQSASAQPASSVEELPQAARRDPLAKDKVRWTPPPSGFLTGETFNYLIYRQQKPVEDKLKKVLDVIHGNLMLDLTPFTLVAKPNRILVMLFSDKQSYMDFTKRPQWSGAASDLRADTMYVLEGRNFYPLSVHELTHLYFDGFFLPTVSPLWLSEGMAVYMQTHSTKSKPAWMDRSLRKIADGRYIALQEMMEEDTLSGLNTEEAEIWYTQAYSLVDYLLNNRSRDEFYRFCNELKQKAPVHQALYRAYGMPFTKVSVLQNVWLHDLAKRLERKNAAQTLLSTQTITTRPARTQSAAPAAAKPRPVRPEPTKIPVLKKVDTRGYRGGF